MRPLHNRHVLATLRAHLGLTQREMADLVGVSMELIKSVELERAPLSTQLGRKIAASTGVSFRWLLQNDSKIPPLSSYTENYTPDFFRGWRVRRNVPLEADLRGLLPIFLLSRYVALRGIAEAAAMKSEHDTELLMYSVDEFVANAKKMYGSVPGFDCQSEAQLMTANQLLVAEQDVQNARNHLETDTKIFGVKNAPPPSPR